MGSFSTTYDQARAKFRAAARGMGARLFCYDRDDMRGAEGETLSVDVAVVGPGNAVRVAIVLAGVHGTEAYAGSAVQIASMEKGGGLSEGLKLVLVHGLNPWGFSHMARTTERNIDLNRNFRASWPGPENAAYAQLAPFLHARRLDAGDDLSAWRAYTSYLDLHGWEVEGRAISGQAQEPCGIYFCGESPDWAHLTFLRILDDHAATAKRVGFIDFHTGIGDFAEVVHLVFAPEGSVERTQAMTWWGLSDIGSSGFRSGTLPPYEGIAANAIAEHLPAALVAGAVIEFGISDAYALFRADRLDRWLRFEGRSDPDYNALRAACRDAMTPTDISWRRHILREGCDRIDRMLTGLVAWQ